jgi:hypothetical protein
LGKTSATNIGGEKEEREVLSQSRHDTIMTGATMTATRAGKVQEGRDPSPSLKPASSGSSDGVEPWDEPPSKATTEDEQEAPMMLGSMMKGAVEFLGAGAQADDDRLEDGDLPTLSLKKESVKGQYVSGQRSTRPLSPPSTKGLEVDVKDNDPPMRRKRVPTPRTAKQIAAQRQFWSQLNPPSPFEADSSRDESDQNRDTEEGPADEMAARRASRANELDNVPKQGDETVDGDDYYYRRNVAKSNSYEEGGGTCFEYTLASIGDICGTGKSSPTIKDSDRPAQIREERELRENMVVDDAEEHTAIEVEYVDPGPSPRRSAHSTPRKAVTASPAATPTRTEKKKQDKRNNKELPNSRAPDGESVELKESETSAWSSSRKNAVLAAMARKAKEDFEKHENQVSKQGSLPVSPRKAESSADQVNTSDIYNSFSPSEKRKFLKLINLGLTPTESTTRVVEERQNKDNFKNPGSSSKKRFSFWKKSAKVDAARSPPLSPRAHAVAKDAQSVSSTAAVGEAEDGIVRQGESEAAIAVPDYPRREGSDAGVSKAYSPPANDTPAVHTAPASPDSEDTPDELQTQEGTVSRDMIAPESPDSEEIEQEQHSRAVVAGVIAAGAAAVGVAAVTADQTADSAGENPVENTRAYEIDDGESSEEEDSVRGQFPRSGVNYYDGVRRELPGDDSDDEFGSEIHSSTEKGSKTSRLASLTGAMSPQSQGFSSLKDSERIMTDDDESLSKQQKSISKSLSPLGRQSKSGTSSSSKDLSSPLSPGGSASARRRYLGIPMLNTGKGFAPLEEDEDSAAAKESAEDKPVIRRDIQLPEEEITSEVAAGAVTAAVTAQKSQESGSPSEVRPLPSMDDPFFGLESEDAGDTATQPQDQEKNEVESQVLPKGQISEVDTSLDSYLESATIQSYAGSHQDQGSIVTGSVISGRSGYTAGTGMTGHTQSSRKRRPGAAKQRIAKAKEADKSVPSKKGWHESIRAAAVTNNRVWDPQKGWVDYKDPDEDVIHDASKEKLRISLNGVSMRSPRPNSDSQAEHDESSRSPSVSVPFPSGWEKERNEMLSSGQAAKLSPREMSVPDSDESQKAPVEGSTHSSEVSNDSPKPQGWEDSMREASAEVSRDGQRWDPKLGWIGLDKNVVESSPLSPRNVPETDEDDDSTDGEDEDEKTAPDNIFAALTKPPSESKIRDAREFAESETRSTTSRSTTSRSQDVKLETTVPSKPPTTRDASEHSTEDSSQVVVPGAGEKYVQLGENGSVKAVRRDIRKKKVSSEREDKHPFHPSTLRKGSASKAARPDTIFNDDKAPLLTEDSSDSTGEIGQTVKVVKQKVDEDDFSLFTANENSESVSSPSRRRGAGPVDVDEVDDLETETESDDGDEDGSWEPDSYMKGHVSPGMFVKPRAERSAELGGFAAAISPTKTPPKLQKSRRDTSPIRSVRDGTKESTPPREVISPEASPRRVMSSPDASPDQVDRSRTIEPSVSVGDDSVGSSSVKQLAQKWEIRAKHGTQIMHNQSGDSFEYDERQITALGDFGPDSSEQPEWPGYYEKQSSQSTSNQEWKSFLGKKVRAESESAAAATLEETKRREGSLGASKPGIPRAPGLPKRIPSGSERGVTDDNGDSSFSFGDGPSDVDGSPGATTAAARRRERALQQSSPSGFSDISPIPPREDSFGVDDVRMERVSDTGTAVEQSSFMKRLSACAAPLSRAFTQNGADGMPISHLDFMRTNPAAQSSPNNSGRFVPAGMCGKQDIINEDEESDEDDSKRSVEHKEKELEPSPTSPTIKILKEVKERSASRGRTRQDPLANVGNEMRSPSSSVASEDFGARTSYLEAIALRSAVSSGSKKNRRRRRSQDSRSTVSDATSESKLSHSERWQAFLERKASQTVTPPGSHAQSSTEISRAAERYASEKMEEMMEVMASRSKSTPKSWRSKDVEEPLDTSYGDSSADSPLSPYRMTATDGDRSMPSKKSTTKRKSESAKAAEELAAARVEAMMAAMTSSNLDEGEI